MRQLFAVAVGGFPLSMEFFIFVFFVVERRTLFISVGTSYLQCLVGHTLSRFPKTILYNFNRHNYIYLLLNFNLL
jgi:hypothetical protein